MFFVCFDLSATCRLKFDDATLLGSEFHFFWYQAFDSTTINKRENGDSNFRRLTLWNSCKFDLELKAMLYTNAFRLNLLACAVLYESSCNWSFYKRLNILVWRWSYSSEVKLFYATWRHKLDFTVESGMEFPFCWYQDFCSTTINKRENDDFNFRRLTLYWPWPWAKVTSKLMVAIPNRCQCHHKVSSWYL